MMMEFFEVFAYLFSHLDCGVSRWKIENLFFTPYRTLLVLTNGKFYSYIYLPDLRHVPAKAECFC